MGTLDSTCTAPPFNSAASAAVSNKCNRAVTPAMDGIVIWQNAVVALTNARVFLECFPFTALRASTPILDVAVQFEFESNTLKPGNHI
jgi:hypothetical protein